MKNRKLNIFINFLIFVGLLLLNSAIIYTRRINDLDELWNFNMSSQIAKGLIPYNDISMIIPPFAQLFGALFLLIYNSLFTFRILAIVLSTLMVFVAYKILLKLTNSKLICFLVALFIEFLFYKYFSYDYNTLIVFFAELMADLEVTKYLKRSENFEESVNYGSIYRKAVKKNFSEKVDFKDYDFLIGILAGLSICTKQTAGIAIAFISIVSIIFDRKFTINKEKKELKTSVNNKNIDDKDLTNDEFDDDMIYFNAKLAEEHKKYKVKALICRIIGIIIPVTLLFVYLGINNAIDEFISYTILGVREFSNTIPYKNLLQSNNFQITSILAVVFPIFLVLVSIYLIISNKDKKQNIIQKLLVLYSLPTLLLIYPISDQMHFLKGTLILTLSLIYFCYVTIGEVTINWKKEIKMSAYYALTCLILAVELYSIYNPLKKDVSEFLENKNRLSKFNHYENIFVSENLANRINQVNSKISELESEGKTVYILDCEAVLYDVVRDKYYKDYDMFNKGNFGKDGINKILKNISDSHDCYYVVRNDSTGQNWQTPREIVDWVKETLKKKDTVSFYDIYYKE